ncbi:hypothetical protein E2562_039301 [Oryza meyeriana var. granulata]|uniref:Uncharacterized protein n=1 Tax=Oryza meyeriana var. granulata TaxID=110450 RepID=A0A6G1EB75_9ORYZ|nr:hypothetical protein E2562_039301 [Oryza meyeriana var. granulata]
MAPPRGRRQHGDPVSFSHCFASSLSRRLPSPLLVQWQSSGTARSGCLELDGGSSLPHPWCSSGFLSLL